MKIKSFAAFIFVLGIFCNAAELKFDAGTCSVSPDGKIELRMKNGDVLGLSITAVLPKWNFQAHAPRKDSISVRQEKDSIELKGSFPVKKESIQYKTSFSVKNGVLSADFFVETPENLETQSKLPPLLIVRSAPGLLDDTPLRIGFSVFKMPASNRWGRGDLLAFQKYDLKTDFLSGPSTMSVWGGKGKTNSVRISMKEDGCGNGVKRWILKLKFSQSKMNMKVPEDTLKTVKEQCLRILYPPMEPEFKTDALIAMLNDPKAGRKETDRVERCLDIRSALYSLREYAVHSPDPVPEFRKLLDDAYGKINQGDWESAEKMLPELKRLSAACAPLPMTAYNPYTWIKSFTQYGYFKHTDGCSYIEPNPWCVLWQDGFRFSLAEDPAAEVIGEDAFRQVRFKAPMKHVSVERDWVSTKWNLPDKTVTFSMLTPVINVEGTKTLELSGFSTPPDSIGYSNRNMVLFGGSLITLEQEKETVASVLMGDQSAKKTVAAKGPKGKPYGFGKWYPGRPWIVLNSKKGGWSLIIILSARPWTAQYENGKFKLNTAGNSHFGIVRLPYAHHPREAAMFAEFFAETTLDYPVGAYETVKDGVVTWKYRYRPRKDIWQTKARRIAPLPPLLQLGDVAVPGMKKSWYNTKYGVYSYVDGESVSFRLPNPLPKGHDLRGVNTFMRDKKQVFLTHLKNGARWQRLVVGNNPRKDAEEQYRKYEETLRFCAENGIKLLVDPHNFIFAVRWRSGFPIEDEKITPFVDMWDRLSKIAMRYPGVVIGYDLYNELGTKEGAEIRWREIAQRCIDRIRKNDPYTPIYVTGMDGANPSGFFNYAAPNDPNLVISFHFYSPHSLTHQKVTTLVQNDPFVFYPGYAPMMDWRGKIHYGGKTVDWYDRWILASLMLPVWETSIRTGLPLHCGEFGVVGWANRKASRSAFCWTRDCCEIFRHAGVRWHLWNGGFGLGNRYVREYMYDLWKNGISEQKNKIENTRNIQ